MDGPTSCCVTTDQSKDPESTTVLVNIFKRLYLSFLTISWWDQLAECKLNFMIAFIHFSVFYFSIALLCSGMEWVKLL